MSHRRHMKLTYKWPIRRFVRLLRRFRDGLYIVGLDMHVGFLLVDGGAKRDYFIHSNYRTPAEVVKERALRSEVLTASRYRLEQRSVWTS